MQTAYANEADYRMCCIHNVTAQLTVILQGCTDMEIMADTDKNPQKQTKNILKLITNTLANIRHQSKFCETGY